MNSFQDAQVFKERCEDSPGILLLCQGDWWLPTPERLALLERENYYVMTAANGRSDIVHWLPEARCIGGMFGHPETVEAARAQFPDKVVERFEGVGGRFLRNITQELPNAMHYAGFHCNSVAPRDLATVDVVSAFSPVALKRGPLLLQVLIESGASAYLFAHFFGGNVDMLESLKALVAAFGKTIEYFHYPFDPYALMRIDGRIVIDCRPIGANSAIVASYLARARVLLHTSTTEGMSNSIMEALANDVRVLVCDDILGPVGGLARALPECIAMAPPEPSALRARLADMLATPPVPGAVKAAFLRAVDPFEVNRRVVRGAQKWFERRGLAWKGHCLGIFGGTQTKLALAAVTAEQSYRGAQPIYPDPEAARNYVAFHANVALAQGRNDLLAALVSELRILARA